MKRILSIMMLLIMTVTTTNLTNVKAAGTCPSGYIDIDWSTVDPSSETPVYLNDTTGYCIDTASDLEGLATYVNDGGTTTNITFLQTAEEIDLTSISNWEPIGQYYESDRFSGTYDGNGNIISNLTITSPKDGNVYNLGLFGLSEGIIQNLILSGVSITTSSSDVDEGIGSVAGYNSGTISNVKVTGSIEVKGVSNYIGGFVGYNDGGSISDSNITTNSSINIDGNNSIGGFVGYNDGPATIINSYISTNSTLNVGSTSPNEYVGGFIGRNLSERTVSNSFVSAATSINIQGVNYLGGFSGENKSSINDSYLVTSSLTIAGLSSYVSNPYIGGFVGYNNGSISYFMLATNTVTFLDDNASSGIAESAGLFSA